MFRAVGVAARPLPGDEDLPIGLHRDRRTLRVRSCPPAATRYRPSGWKAVAVAALIRVSLSPKIFPFASSRSVLIAPMASTATVPPTRSWAMDPVR
ncbi:hypothetical protein [Nocardia arthritidis]|uniref:Uncharacterized protein n=1 Tax=Nocardia arthritidis TaxID=228602 RepID=A0A6G9YI36_9NOCA|nr:hypothetical protein [Nocardia arthritidis]QIS12965.1 hypothetical protein F5544_25555 [Nocardia arthritidis]